MKTLLLMAGALVFGVGAACAADRLAIHEWGTLTTLDDEEGGLIPGINADDEPVPSFVHRIMPGLPVFFQPQPLGKSVPAGHPDVTVRLETPVLYVHAPPGFTGALDVTVKFNGGWLTEFYPDARAEAPGIDAKTLHAGHITGATVGTLHWAGLKVGGNPAGPATTERVWLAPRNVAADAIRTLAGESEQFIFYRGVGNLGSGDLVLNLVRDEKTGTVRAGPEVETKHVPAPPFWLADIRADGMAAFQRVESDGSSRPFAAADYSTANVAALRASLEAELISAGLYHDEAEALLNTWEVSYFKSPGLRAFYLWPRVNLDHLLPLTVSPAADITRVMVGRIELVTPELRATMARIGNSKPDESQLLFQHLGRFRDALLLDQERRHSNPGLEQFLRQSAIAYYQP